MERANEETRIISMHILKWNGNEDKALFLASAFELGFINFLKRQFVKGPLIFAARTVVRKSRPGDNICVKIEEAQDALAYCVLRENKIGGVLITSNNYPDRVAIKILHEILDLFEQKVNPTLYNNIKQDLETDFKDLGILIKKYQDPKEADKLLKLENELDGVKNMLHKTLSDLADRGQKLEDMMDKCDDINKVSLDFYKKAKKTNSCC